MCSKSMLACSPCHSISCLPGMCKRISAITPKPSLRQTYTYRTLTSFVLADIHQSRHPIDFIAVESLFHYLLCAQILFDIQGQERIETIIRQQVILILLFW